MLEGAKPISTDAVFPHGVSSAQYVINFAPERVRLVKKIGARIE